MQTSLRATTTLQRRRAAVSEAVAREQAAAEQEGNEHPASATDRMQEHRAFLREARNQNTTRTYTSAMRQFRLWAETIEDRRRAEGEAVDCDHPEPLDVSLYVRYLVQVRQASRAMVHGALAAITDHIRYDRTADYDPCNAPIVQQTRDVLLAETRAPSSKKELTFADVRRIIDAIDRERGGDAWLQQRDAAMFLLAYSALLRGSEVARLKVGHIEVQAQDTIAPAAEGPQRKRAKPAAAAAAVSNAPERDDVAGEAGGRDGVPAGPTVMRVYVDPLSKNDKAREGHTRLLEEQQGGGYCVVRRVRLWIRTGRRGAEEDDNSDAYLFPTRAGGRMSNDTPRGRLVYWLGKAGFTDVEQYGFHSLRAGGATDASRAGVSERDIQRHGNWRSSVVQTYIRSNDDDRLHVSQAHAAAAAAAAAAATTTTVGKKRAAPRG